MRNGIYAYEKCIVTIDASETGLMLVLMGSSDQPQVLSRSNTVSLDPGVYRVFSADNVQVQVTPPPGADVELVARASKDPWPDPPPKVLSMFKTTTTAIQEFFLFSKQIDV